MIRTQDLTKRYDDFVAVQNLNLHVRSGEIYGFLGPNGAGKTTTILMLLGLLTPTSGAVYLFDCPSRPISLTTKQRIGVVSENPSLYSEMTAHEYLDFFARLYGVPQAEKRIRHLLERVNLWERRQVEVRGYSRGMRQKLSLVRALLHDPDLLILDEPVSGLDPYGILQVRELLQEENARGKTIFISSHILSEIERTAHRVGIIARGRLRAEDAMASLKRKVRPAPGIEVELSDAPAELARTLSDLPFVQRLETQNGQWTVYTAGAGDHRLELSRFLTAQGVTILGMRALEASLEEAFVTITEAHVQSWTEE